jgi:hypothetical protein
VGDRIREFLCPACGCRFKAGPMDYEIVYNGTRHSAILFQNPEKTKRAEDGRMECRCPECSLTAREVES